jgi:outer membrane protein OmpA-like peptidoglycan-associated protein
MHGCVAGLVAALVVADPGIGARIDLGIALPVSSPQNRYFTPGFGAALTGALSVLPILELEAQLGYAILPRTLSSLSPGPGSLLEFSVGARLHRAKAGASLIPWVEALGGIGASGGVRLPITLTGGLSFRPVERSGAMIGLFARLNQVFGLGGPSGVGYATFDATLVSFGVSLELATTPSIADSDGDHVPDGQDACPHEAGAQPNGCPAVRDAEADADGDGVLDSVDRCPKQAEDRDGFNDSDGCPDLDDDGDGVADIDDGCPRVSGSAAMKGCPDGDSDGVADDEDECPTVAGKRAQKGCPVYDQVVVTEVKIELKQKIFFAFGTNDILPKSKPLLSEVAKALKDRASMCVRIEGHTDNKGDKPTNQNLSGSRAQSIRAFLVSEGISEGRMSAQGYADTLPIDDNKTVQGRENNRRVEFVIVPCKETP